MYLIGIKNGVHPSGEEGTLSTKCRPWYELYEIAQEFAAKYNLDAVYGMMVYPVDYREMSNPEFVHHVRKNCKRFV